MVCTPTKKSSKLKHPSTPSTVSTTASGVSSKSHYSNNTTKSIEAKYKKFNVESDSSKDTGNNEGDEDDDDEDSVLTGFDVIDIEFEKIRSLVNAANHLLPLAKRQELAGASHREYVKAILDTQNLSVCKQFYQLVAMKVGDKDFKETMKEVAQFGNKSKPLIVNKIMHHVNRFNRQNSFVQNQLEFSDNEEEDKHKNEAFHVKKKKK